ncbi:hypothetical protein KKH23_06625 [Patescibacteria group bacterium]|nr:hypothetical protein [Patescibacteria group bacterium]
MVFGTTPQNWPLTRLTPWYNGPYGIAGADAPLGVRTEGRPVVIYVDDTHPRANDNNWGTDPLWPKATVQSAVDSIFLVQGSVIAVAAEATIAESVLVGATRPEQCTIMGLGNPCRGPTWTSAAAAQNCLELRAAGWMIRNIRFQPNTLAAGIYLARAADDSYAAHHTVIEDCDFDGRWSGLYGIHTYGNPSQVYVLHNRFHEMHNGGQTAGGIYLDQAPVANPFMWIVKDNIFWEEDNHIFLDDNTCGANGCLFKGNSFFLGVNIPAVTMIDMRGGTLGGNVFVENFFGGDYSHTGGYWENALNPGSWIGNVAEDIAEPEVGDNGFTISVPLA